MTASLQVFTAKVEIAAGRFSTMRFNQSGSGLFGNHQTARM
jgi:hypothetical protein